MYSDDQVSPSTLCRWVKREKNYLKRLSVSGIYTFWMNAYIYGFVRGVQKRVRWCPNSLQINWLDYV